MTAIDVHTFEVSVNHAVLRGEWAGEGPAVLLVHAGICDRRMWDAEFSALAEHHRVVRYDLRGVGDSVPAPASDGGSFSHHDDLLAVLDALAIDRATLVGCSLGGRIALDATLAFPDRLASLVVVCFRPNGADSDPSIQSVHERINAALDRGEIDEANELELQLWVDGPYRSAAAVDSELREWIGSMNRPSLAGAWQGGGELDLDPPAIDRLGEIACPVLVMIGELDVASTVSSGEQLATAIPGARLVRFPRSAHLPSLEEPESFLRHLTDFLTPTDAAVERPRIVARDILATAGT